EGVSVNVLSNELDLDPESARVVEEDRGRSRNLSTLKAYAEADADPALRQVRFRFLVSPVEILGKDGRVTGVRIERNRLELGPSGSLRPRGTGETFDMPCGMVLRSVGYLGTQVPGVPHDPRTGTVPHLEGRVLGDDGQPKVGEYVVGWAKRGPSGVIGTNKADAAATVKAMIQDVERGVVLTPEEGRDPRDLLTARAVRWIDESGWARLDAHETGLGKDAGRPRVKVCTVEEMLRVVER
ncbi:MAG: NADP oxidoreductase, partial [Gemmatimonadota bacterium]|nr:NADP oxidoreductase [Gemmatimonadota bacterium]